MSDTPDVMKPGAERYVAAGSGVGAVRTPGTAGNRMRPLTAGELRRVLDEPLVASVGCLDESGAPYVVPLWFEYDGESFWLVPGHAPVSV